MTSHYLFQELSAIELSQANEVQTEILQGAKKQVGFIPNMYSGMVNVPAVLNTYLHGYQQFREGSEFSADEQEVVFLAISIQNACHYCTAAHSTLAANFSGVPEAVLTAIRAGEAIPDARLAAVYAMAVELNDSKGRPDPAIVERFIAAGFSEKHILAIVLAISVKVISNYSNHLFDTEVDEMFSAYKVS